MSEPTVAELLLERLQAAEDQAAKVPALETKVQMLQETVDRLIGLVQQAGVAIFVTGVLTVVAALILKGVIG